jgi:glutamine synthetase
MAAQVFAGLDGLARGLEPGPATDAPYAATVPEAARLPTSLAEALDALAADAALRGGLGEPMARLVTAVKRQEIARHAAAEDAEAWVRREYFGRY